jgi:hypothetical protein
MADMGHRTFSPKRHVTLCASFLLPFLFGGCSQSGPVPVSRPLIKQGIVHGGQQPVSGATIQLYAVGLGGDGSASTPLLTQVVTTDSGGNFSISNDYTCPSPSSLVYLVATGGNPGFSGNVTNPSLAMMTALGQCGALTASTYILVNELTTVAAVWSLAPFMTSYGAVGSNAGDASALANAFTLAAELVNPSTGTTPGLNVPAGLSVPIEQINTLADILAPCVNSRGGVAGDGSVCGNLFTYTTPAGAVSATDTIGAGLRIADDPTLNTSSLFSLMSAASPYQPTMTVAPANLSVRMEYSSPSPSLSMAITPSALVFPDTPVNTISSGMDVTIANTVQFSNLVVNGASIVGPNAGDFTLKNYCDLPVISFCGLEVTFAPQSIGVRNAFLLITDNAPDSPQLIPLTGVGITQPDTVTVSPAVLNFYEPGEIKTVTFSNSRNVPISISGIQITSPNWTQFNNCGSQLDAQSTCMIAITAGQSYGQFSGTLTVLDGDSSGQPVVQLGSDIRKLSGPVIDLGQIILGTQSSQGSPLTGGVYDHTAGGFDFYSYSGTLSGGANPNDFYLSPSSCEANTTAGSNAATCQISVGGKPSVAGHLSAYLSTNAGETYLVKQTGMQADYAFVLSPPALDFGSHPMGTAAQLSYTVDAISAGGDWINNITISQAGGNAGDFSWELPTTYSDYTAVPRPGTVTFTPKAMGQRSAIITFKDANGYTQSMLVNGQGLESVPIFSPSALQFGNTVPGATSAPQTVTVTLSGGHPATAQILEQNSPFQLSQNTTCAQGANPCQFQVIFSPTTAGTPTGTLQVTDTVTGFSATAALSGTAGAADISVSPASLTFAPRSVGVSSLPQNIVVTNSGYLPLTIRWVQIQSSNPLTQPIGDYSETNNCGTLNQGQSCIISVVFTPLASGERDIFVVVGSNAISGPTISIPVTGTGN